MLIDGESVYENHSVSSTKLLQLAGVPFTSTDMWDKTEEEVEAYVKSGGSYASS